MSLVIVNEANAHDTREFLTKRLQAIQAQAKLGDLEELALIIGASAAPGPGDAPSDFVATRR